MKFSWHDVAEDVEKHAHKLAEDIFALEPDVTGILSSTPEGD